ncbi:DUF2799 domain-containing protein [Enterovibrio norvegicus]|uniref:DUF2799 domain-containing protein n=1 Tax=Enterovibrio norvegicus TaxID=188144 RepID=UPI00352CED90
MVKSIALSLLVMTMVGCVSIDSAESLAAEGKWQAIGESDGVRGLPSRSLSDLAELAQKAGVASANVGNYESGYMSGVDKYCDVNNAYDIGLSGFRYLGVCANAPDGLRFQMEYQRGFEDFQYADQTF